MQDFYLFLPNFEKCIHMTLCFTKMLFLSDKTTPFFVEWRINVGFKD